MYESKSLIVSDKEDEVLFKDYLEMDILYEKLKSLNYYSDFVIPLKIKPINNYYFMISSNFGEHFILFCQIAMWLIRKSGKNIDDPQDDIEDPNNTIAKILNVVREEGISVEFPPNKLKQGTGRYVVFILNKLCDIAISKNHFKFDSPVINQEPEDKKNDDITSDDDHDNDVVVDQTEDDILATYSDYSDDSEKSDYDNEIVQRKVNSESKSDINITMNLDEESRQKELERVTPLLRIVTTNKYHDWRARLNFMQENYSQVKNTVSAVKLQLTKLGKSLGNNLEKIKSREKYLNKEFEASLKELMNKMHRLSEVKENYNSLGSGVNEKLRTLSDLNQKLKSYKEKADVRGNFVTDGTPLVNIKKGISKIKSDIIDMDVRIGVLQYFSFHTEINEKSRLEKN